MLKQATIALMLLGAVCLNAAEKKKSAPQKTLPTTKTSGWVSSLAKAKLEAEAFKQPLFIFCTDELDNSNTAEKELINTKRFKQFAADNLIMYRLIKDDENADIKLQKEHTKILKNVKRYCPSFVVIDHNGKLIYKGTKIQPRHDITDGAFLSDLKEILETFGYAVNGAALEGYTPPTARMTTKSTADPSKIAPPPPKPNPKKKK